MKKIMLLLSAILLTSCGYFKSPHPSIPIENMTAISGHVVDIIADNWRFDKNTYVVPAGEITVSLKNVKGFHGIEIEGTDISIEGDGSYTTTVEPGEYKILCSIICGTGHDAMIASLVVTQ